jgi:hypothetical protein
MVNWTRTTLPKEYGDLGILDLNRFSKALRLRWLWHEWASPKKAWVGTELPCNQQDRLLFIACTTITLGDGKEHRSGPQAGSRGEDPETLHHSYMPKRRKRNGWWKRHCRTIHGSRTSTTGPASQRRTFHSSSRYGNSSLS